MEATHHSPIAWPAPGIAVPRSADVLAMAAPVSRETAEQRLCGCGCGAPVVRRYRPGHDARHKAAIAQAAQATRADGQPTRAAAAATEDAAARGWAAAIPAATLHTQRVYRGNMERMHIDDVQVFIVCPSGEAHSNHSCRRVTAEAKKAGRINRITKRAEYGFVTRLDRAGYIPCGFDICPDCLRDWTWLDWVQSQQIAKEVANEAISPTPKKTTPSSLPFSILPDTDPLPIPSPWAPPTGQPIPLPIPA